LDSKRGSRSRQDVTERFGGLRRVVALHIRRS
jgi:hypothetical protein